jgi:hypothetical protein
MNAVRWLTLLALVLVAGAALPKADRKEAKGKPVTVDPADLISIHKNGHDEGWADRLKAKYDGKSVRYTALLATAKEDVERYKYRFEVTNEVIERRGKFEPATHRVWCVVYFKDDKEEAAVFAALKESQAGDNSRSIRLIVRGTAKVTEGDLTPLTIDDCRLLSLKTLAK